MADVTRVAQKVDVGGRGTTFSQQKIAVLTSAPWKLSVPCAVRSGITIGPRCLDLAPVASESFGALPWRRFRLLPPPCAQWELHEVPNAVSLTERTPDRIRHATSTATRCSKPATTTHNSCSLLQPSS
jgi:hypothetical protein